MLWNLSNSDLCKAFGIFRIRVLHIFATFFFLYLCYKWSLDLIKGCTHICVNSKKANYKISTIESGANHQFSVILRSWPCVLTNHRSTDSISYWKYMPWRCRIEKIRFKNMHQYRLAYSFLSMAPPSFNKVNLFSFIYEHRNLKICIGIYNMIICFELFQNSN